MTAPTAPADEGLANCPGPCGMTATEPHPRRPGVVRCSNCKEWMSGPTAADEGLADVLAEHLTTWRDDRLNCVCGWRSADDDAEYAGHVADVVRAWLVDLAARCVLGGGPMSDDRRTHLGIAWHWFGWRTLVPFTRGGDEFDWHCWGFGWTVTGRVFLAIRPCPETGRCAEDADERGPLAQWPVDLYGRNHLMEDA